jgi:hypothetical protein
MEKEKKRDNKKLGRCILPIAWSTEDGNRSLALSGLCTSVF